MVLTPRSLFTPRGLFAPWALVCIHALFALGIGWMDVLLHWVRTGQAVGEDRLFYGLLFGAYAAISAAFFQVVFLRRTHAAGPVLLGLVATFLVFIAARWAGDQWLLPLLGDEPNYPDHTGLWSFALDNVSYALVPMGVGALVHLFEVQVMAFRERAELAFRQRASELEVLRARMAPHFLFNTLNNLYALAQRPGADLSAPVHDLAQLMRYVAKHPGDVVALGVELEQVRRLVDLQRLRYLRPVRFEVNVGPQDERLMIPTMLLLTLVENAFKHGDPCSEQVPLTLSVRRDGTQLSVACTNALGKGTTSDGVPTGQCDLVRRLQLMHGASARARFHRSTDRYLAEVHIPIFEAHEAAELSGDRR